MKYDDIPKCCKKCTRLDSEYNEYNDNTYYYCSINIFFPTKKQSCVKQNPIKPRNNRIEQTA